MMSNFAGINEKPSSKVLRPPGGNSSDIFGKDMPQTPRSIKNHMQSHIFSSEKNALQNNGDQPRRAQKNVDSYSRLFGEPNLPNTPSKNHMRSSIPFGKNTEVAAQLLANGNNRFIEKSGSVSSASSSVSSSTENLKIHGLSKTERDEACPKPVLSSESESVPCGPLDIDLPCEDKSLSPRINVGKADVGAGDVASQTRRDSGCNPNNPYSLSNMSQRSTKKEPLGECVETFASPSAPRNPITGLGLGEDGVGGIKPKKPKDRRDGNPVTGEGYKAGSDMNSSIPSLNGANQVINKNRIPPGGFSSGLW